MKLNIRSLVAAILVIGQLNLAKALPAENKSVIARRISSSGLMLEGNLSANVFRSEAYQAEYTIQVPYEATETYTENVPYTEREAYTDYEDYTTSEYICHDRTRYENRCENRRVCQRHPGERVCENVRDCDRPAPDQSLLALIANESDVNGRPREGGPGPYDPNPPTRPEPRPQPRPEQPRPNPRPEPRPQPPQCRERQVCRERPGREECENRHECRQVPVTHQECGYETVVRSRPVTRYRDVTRYRQEERTRTVTRYRSETRCCETRYRDVFDHQYSVAYRIEFPVGSDLIANETETFKVQLDGTETAPLISLQAQETIFGYKILSQQKVNNVFVIRLEKVPRYTADQFKESSVKDLVVVPMAESISYRFENRALWPRVKAFHQVIIRDLLTKEIVVQTELVANDERLVQGVIPHSLDTSRDYLAEVTISRQSELIQGGKVTHLMTQKLDVRLDEAALKNVSMVGEISASGYGNDLSIAWKDSTANYSQVATQYTLTLLRVGVFGSKKTIGSKTFKRKDLALNSSIAYRVSIKDFGFKGSVVQDELDRKSKIQIVIEVKRTSPAIKDIKFWVNNTVTL